MRHRGASTIGRRTRPPHDLVITKGPTTALHYNRRMPLPSQGEIAGPGDSVFAYDYYIQDYAYGYSGLPNSTRNWSLSS